MSKDKSSDQQPRRAKRLRGEKPEFPDGLVPESNASSGFYGRVFPLGEIGKYAAVYINKDDEVDFLSPLKRQKSRPVDTLGTPAKDSKLPNSVNTPGGTKLSKRSDYGEFATYSESVSHAPMQDHMKGADLEEKSVSFTLTKEHFKKIDLERDRFGKNRGTSQKQVMGQSASEHASAQNMEWLHLLAFQFLGFDAQNKENLVAGTAEANTDMLVVAEQNIRKMVEKTGSVDVNVTAMVEKDTHIAQSIDYKISRQGMRDINFHFNGKNREKPTVADGEYAKKFIEKASQSAVDRLLKDKGDNQRNH